jgi:hypothetical protein
MNMRASYTESKSRSQKHPKRQGHGSEQDVCPVAWRRFGILSSPLSLFDFTVASERRSGAILVDAGGNHSLSDIDDSGVSGSVIVVSSVSAKLNGYNTGELDGCLHMTRFEKNRDHRSRHRYLLRMRGHAHAEIGRGSDVDLPGLHGWHAAAVGVRRCFGGAGLEARRVGQCGC